MGKTMRRGVGPRVKDENQIGFEYNKKIVHDKSCRNPMCCGGELSRKARRRERASLKAELRIDPEHVETSLSAKRRKY